MNAVSKRCLIVHTRPTSSAAGRLSIISGTRTEYLYTSRPEAGGVAYELSNLAGPETRTYSCVIAPDGNTCTCPGFGYRRSCRHVLALASLTARDAASAQMPPAAPSCRVCKGTGFRRFATECSRGLSACLACDGGQF